MNKLAVSAIAFLILGMLISSCSGVAGNGPVTPSTDAALTQYESGQLASDPSNTYLMGYYDVYYDIEKATFEIVENRTAAFTLNIVPFLNQMAIPKNGITFDSIVVHTDDPSFLGVDVSFTVYHPFPGYDQYQAYDLRGVVIGNGAELLNYSGLNASKHGVDLWMKNPDGYTRWFNPTDFTTDKIFGYTPGGWQNLAGNAQLNPYKYYSKHLDPSANLWSYLTEDDNFDGLFENGSSRKMELEFPLPPDGIGLKFGYAIVVAWEDQGPTGPFHPYHGPETIAANVTQTPDVWFDGTNSGGNLILDIDLFSWELQPTTIKIDSDVLDGIAEFDAPSIGAPVSENVSTYHVEAPAGTFNSTEGHEYWVIAEYEDYDYTNGLPDIPHADGPLAAFFRYDAYVADGPGAIAPTAIMVATSDTTIQAGETVSFDASASTGTAPLTFTWDFDGDGDYSDTYTGAPETPTHKFDTLGEFDVTVKVTNIAGEDISDVVAVNVLPYLDPDDTYVDGDYAGGDSDGTIQKPFLTIQDAMAAVQANHKIHVDYLDGGTNIYDTVGLIVKSNITLLGDNWNNGGPGKPILDNETDQAVITAGYSPVSNFTLEGFQLGVTNVPDSDEHWGIYLYGGSNNTIRHNQITDYADDTGLVDGDGFPIYMYNCSDSTIEFNEIGPFTWHSDTPGEYATVLWGIYAYGCNNIIVKNNFIHDYTVDYDGGGGGQIRVFLLHIMDCTPAEIHNNLICHIEGISNYDYRINGINIEGYSGSHEFHVYNNTVDFLDTSNSNGWTAPIGLICYSANFFPPWTNTYINNSIVTDIYPHNSGQAGGFYGTYWDGPVYPSISYCTGYNLSTTTDYFGSNWDFGDGITNYPGINPQYVDNTTAPYDYHYQSGSGCEMGDPNFLDWDDTGTPSGDPGETDPNNRSRMGCFGGPDGDWDPNDL